MGRKSRLSLFPPSPKAPKGKNKRNASGIPFVSLHAKGPDEASSSSSSQSPDGMLARQNFIKANSLSAVQAKADARRKSGDAGGGAPFIVGQFSVDESFESSLLLDISFVSKDPAGRKVVSRRARESVCIPQRISRLSSGSST